MDFVSFLLVSYIIISVGVLFTGRGEGKEHLERIILWPIMLIVGLCFGIFLGLLILFKIMFFAITFIFGIELPPKHKK